MADTKKPATPRRRKLSKKQKKQVAKEEVKKNVSLPNSFKLTKIASKVVLQNKGIYAKLLLVYLLINGILAAGFASVSNNISSLKSHLENQSHIQSSLHSYSLLLGGSVGSGTSSVQTMLLVIESLVAIYLVRNLFSNNKVKVKDAYYKSMGQLIPFVLVIAVILIQCLPFVIGSIVMALLIQSTVINSTFAYILGGSVLTLLFFWTCYMLSCSLFSLYIVTLPDMHPRQALKSAKKLVAFKRWGLIRKLLYLPIAISIFMGIFVFLFSLITPIAAAVVFYILVSSSLFFAHTYIYSLYRELIK